MKSIEVKITGSMASDVKVYLFGVPERCDRCGGLLDFEKIGFPRDRHAGAGIYETVFHVSFCIDDNCKKYYITEYIFRPEPGNLNHYDFYAQQMAVPLGLRQVIASERVVNLSPRFVEIYQQALTSEYLGLHQLTGIGLRKSLEFLVKDYAISLNPDKAGLIATKPLAACIAEYISDNNVRECAKRAAWLGNDETHFARRWEDRDIDDLKDLIELTLVWLEYALRTAEFIKKMQP